MWANQLREYRQQTERKPTRLSPRHIKCNNNHSQQSTTEFDKVGQEAEPAHTSGASSVNANKNLDKCAQLLSEMLQRDPGLLSKPTSDGRASKIPAGQGRKLKYGKVSTSIRSRKPVERGVKPAVSRKVGGKVVSRSSGKKQEHAIDSVSETSTELQVRLTGPKPMPLNNSEVVIQVTGVDPKAVPTVHAGQVVKTKVPYNDRILCSTPNASPSSKVQLPQGAATRGHYSLHSDASDGHKPTAAGSGYFPGGSFYPTQGPPMTMPVPAAATAASQIAADRQAFVASSSRDPVKFYQDLPADNPNVTNSMRQYVTESNQFLMDYIQSCLAKNCLPSALGPAPPGLAPVQGWQLPSQMTSQEKRQGAEALLPSAPAATPVSNTSGTGCAGQYDPHPGSIPVHSTISAATPQADVNIDAILRRYGVDVSLLQRGPSQPAAAVVNPVQSTDCYPAHGTAAEKPLDDSSRYQGGNVSNTQAGIEKGDGEDSIRPNVSESHVPADPAQDTSKTSAVEGDKKKESHKDTKSRHKERKSSKKEKVKKRPATAPAAGIAPVQPVSGIDKVSPAHTKTQVRSLLYLLGELRAAVTGEDASGEVGKLVDALHRTVTEISPSLATSGLGTDLDLALQPLRSENAHLRRRIRILTQQFRGKCQAIDEASKPDPSFQVIQLELERHGLETQLKEEEATTTKLRAAITTLAGQLQGLMAERGQMVRILETKDSECQKLQKEWTAEADQLREALRTKESDYKELQAALTDAAREASLLEVTVSQKTSEIDRLQHLVKSLQDSMNRLLQDLKGSRPTRRNSVDDISHYIQNLDSLLRTDREPGTKSGLTQESRPAAPADLMAEGMPSLPASLLAAVPDPTPAGAGLGDEEDVQHGLERAYQLLDRIDAAILMPGKAAVPSESAAQPVSSSPRRPRTTQELTKDRPSNKAGNSSERQPRLPKVVSPSRSHKAVADFDPSHDSYQGQLTQELLQEHDRQNGVDEDIIQRMLVRSQHEQQPGGLATAEVNHFSSDYSSSSGQPPEQEPWTKRVATEPKKLPSSTEKQRRAPSTDSEYEKQSGYSGLPSAADLDTTEYLNPPATMTSPAAAKTASHTNKAKTGSGPTVKELLAPLARRIMHSPAAKQMAHYGLSNLSEPGSSLSPGTLSTDSEFGGGEGDGGLEGNSTLTLVDVEVSGEKLQQALGSESSADETRYSLSDYFRKYHGGSEQPPTGQVGAIDSAAVKAESQANARGNDQEGALPHTAETGHKEVVNPRPVVEVTDAAGGRSKASRRLNLQEGKSQNKGPISQAAGPQDQSTTFTTVSSSTSMSRSLKGAGAAAGATPASPQEHLYKGTELDTSLSTIPEAETTSVLSASTITSLAGTVTSIDEQDFREGLAKLDANIARLQQSLKKQVVTSFQVPVGL